MDSQQPKAQRLPKMVAPFQVRPFMGQHVADLLLGQAGGDIDPGTQRTQYEWSIDIIAEPHLIAVVQVHPDISAQPQKAPQAIQQHDCHTHEPQNPRHRQHRAQRIGLLPVLTGKMLGEYTVDRFVDLRDTGLHRGSAHRNDGLRNSLGAWQ